MNRHLFIVEGKTDVSKLKHLGIKYIIKTDGLTYISRETINFIKVSSSVRPLVLLLDPDGPGKKIKQLILSEINQDNLPYPLTIIDVDKKKAIAHKKVGVAQVKEEILKEYLAKILIEEKASEEIDSCTIKDLIELNLSGDNSKVNRMKLLKHYPLNISSTKTLLDGINILKITKEDLGRIINE